MSFSELELPNLFYIVVTGGAPGIEGQLLTDEDGRVTITPPSNVRDGKQEWQISFGDDKNLIIKRPGDFIPPPFLSYDGAPDPKEGDRILLNFTHTEWKGVDSHLRPVGSNLGIAVAPPTIFPPILILSSDNQLQWKIVVPPPVE